MKRHPLDPFSLVFGAVFAVLGIVFLVASSDIWALNPKWIWPVPLIVVGALIIAIAARDESGSQRAERIDDGDDFRDGI